jgi:hypothetical protein
MRTSRPWLVVAPEFDEVHPERDDERHVPLQAARRADTETRAHEEAQIEPADVHQQSFQDVCVPSQMRPTHRPGLIEMRIGPFQPFSALP